MFAKKDFSFLLLVWRVLYSRLAISPSSRLDCCKHILLIPGKILTPILESQMFGSPLFPSVSLLLRLHLYCPMSPLFSCTAKDFSGSWYPCCFREVVLSPSSFLPRHQDAAAPLLLLPRLGLLKGKEDCCSP